MHLHPRPLRGSSSRVFIFLLFQLAGAVAFGAPAVSNVTPPGDGTHTVGAQLDFTVTFDEVVNVVTSAGTPTLSLNLGNKRRFAYYVSGTGSEAFTFRYTVQPGDNDSDGLTMTSSITLNDGIIRSTTNVAAGTSFTAPTMTGVLVDTPPIVTAIRRLSPTTTITAANAVTYRVSFSEPVDGVDASDFTLAKTHAAYGTISSVGAAGDSEFDVAVTQVSGAGTLRLDLNATATDIIDAGGLPIADGFTAGQIYAPLTATHPVGWGRNLYGRLGNGTDVDVSAPSAVSMSLLPEDKYLVEVSAGGYHSLGLTADGLIVAWGRNVDGQLGLGHNGNRFAPRAVVSDGVLADKTLVAVAAGGYHSLALDSDGKVYAWGKNDQGQLGNGTNDDSNVPTAVDATGVLADKKVVAIAAGAEFSIALTDDGRVYTWGDGGDGQLGQGSFAGDSNVPVAVTTNVALDGKTVIAVAAGSEHALALTSEGKVYAWGSNGHGQLGTNMFGTNRTSPQPVYHNGTYGTKTIVAIAAGWDHSIALTSEGRIYVWGENDHGQVGNNSTTNRNDPGLVNASGVLSGKFITAVTGGDSHTTALASSGDVYNWGFNDYGQLGNNTSGTDTLLPVAVDTSGALLGKTVVSLGSNWGGVFNLAIAFTTTGPRVIDVVAPTAGAYRAGDELDFEVTFNNAVTVDTTGGTPKLSLTVGAAAGEAVYVSGSGSDTLVFRHTVQDGDNDSDGLAVDDAIVLDGGTIRDDSSLDATLTFAPPDASGVIIDTTAPLITSGATASGTYGVAFAAYTISASGEAVSFAADDLPAGLSVDPGSGEITGTPTAAGSFDVTIFAVDAAGNTGSAVLTFTVAKAPASVALTGLTRTYNGAPKPVSATTTPTGLTVVITYDGSSPAPTNVGSYAVVVTIDNSNYAGTANGTLVIQALSQTISFAVPANLIIGQSITLSATASSGLPVSFSVISGPATLSGGTLTTTGVGSVTVRASQAGSSTYDTATNVDRTFIVTVGSPTVTTPEQVPAPPAGGTAELVVSNSNPNVDYQWQRNGANLPSGTGPTLMLDNVQPPTAGLYTYTATLPGGSGGTSEPVIVGIDTTEKVIGTGEEVGTNILHPNGNTYDQVLLEGPGATVTAEAAQITRISFVDLSDDIVQIEFSGAGTLSVVMDDASSPAPAANYNQPGVDYVKGHVGLVITGANETSNVSVFTVGRTNAINQSLFKDGVNYDGVANIAFIAVQSTNGKFGGIRTGNVNYFANQGFTGVYAPGVKFAGPVNIGDVSAFDSATPVLIFGEIATVNITGGNLAQDNGQPVRVSGITQVKFIDGTTSQGETLPAQTNEGVLVENGVDVTDLLVNP